MLIFNCTKAAQDFLTVTRQGEKQTIVTPPPSAEMANDHHYLKYADGTPAKPFQWLLHVVNIKRKHCLIAMEINSRFSITITSVKKADVAMFLKYFKAFLAAQMSGYGQSHGIWQESEIDGITGTAFDHMEEVHWFRRSDRSAQTQINEIARDLRDSTDEEPALLADDNRLLWFNQQANNFLRKSKAFPDQDYITPVEEMFIFWRQYYQGATEHQLTTTRQTLSEARRKHMGEMIANLESALHQADEDGLPPMQDGSSGVIVPGGGPLSVEEMDFLNETLLKYETESSLENISSLHGFLTAIVSGPNALPPSAWLHEIWGSEEDQPAWKNMDEVQRFMGAMFKMMNHISQELMETPDAFTTILMGDHQRADITDWCFGYMTAVDLDYEAWDSLPPRLSGELEFINQSAFMLEIQALSGRQMQQRNDHLTDAARQLHAYWLQRGMEKPQPVTVPKVGRNDPCPCGSGKKYKKCCLH